MPVWLHVSAHCGRTPGVGRVAVLINFHTTQDTAIVVAGAGAMAAYHLQGAVYSHRVTLNGNPLDLLANGSLPTPRGVPVAAGGVVRISAQSIVFVEVMGHRPSVCG